MSPDVRLNFLIDRAIQIVGSQRKVANLLDINPANLIDMKKGRRNANLRIYAGLRTIIGEDAGKAFIEEFIAKLEEGSELEKMAAKLIKERHKNQR